MKNLIIRTLSGIIFLAVMLGGLLVHPLLFCLVFTFIVAVMMYEYLHITLKGTHTTAALLSAILGIAGFIITFAVTAGHAGTGLYLILPPLLSLLIILLLYDKSREAYRNYPYLLSGLLYIALPFSLLNLIVFDEAGHFDGTVLLSLFILMWASDVGAYLSGITFGRKNGHRLFPSISPKKTWEGYIGSLVISVVAGIVLSATGLLPYGTAHSIAISLIVNVFGTLGDLAESQLKRNFDIKDSGRIMPGHGGLLDRFDGCLLAFPVAVCYILVFA